MFGKTTVRGPMAALLRFGAILILLGFPASQVHAQTLTTLLSFNGSDGATPYAGLALNGTTLYGTTKSGGSHGGGTVSALPPVAAVPRHCSP